MTTAATDLFPPLEPYATGYLRVDDTHELYWEECGNPQGVPVLYLHGGPGARIAPVHRRFFDPEAYRILLFDQRGCGYSRPTGELKNNDTPHLIADIETLRTHWGVEKWHVFGGSWGSTLALAYAEAYPQRVSALMLRGIFLLRKWEIDWFLKGMAALFPDLNEKLLNYLPADQRADPLPAYYDLMTNPDPAIHTPAAYEWSSYEVQTSTLLPTLVMPDPVKDLTMARIEAHFFKNSLFEPDDKLLRDVDKIRHIPGIIVQGRYDVVCPAVSSYDLHKAWPEAEYVIVPDAGHSALEPGIRRELVRATEKFKTL